MQYIHSNGKCLVGLLGYGTIGHGACFKSLYDLINTLYLFDGDTFFRIFKIHQAAQITALLPVHQFRILFKHAVVPSFCGLLQHMDRPGIIAVFLPLTPHFVNPHTLQLQAAGQSQGVKCFRMPHVYIICYIF